ncbi:hypothetical protein Athai_58640 [Actinocatenispora thailandica]|uniref:Uncharacterized protein n=1 Tax=Actinocatenispora thailandica TaxID=227318 RepID=A0A7R7I098_9ACTN|nr:hypothetical protein [Actinocatenispora thailandica]BCJ38361.1 hypothetical protein Athai_58640 [Actinocatenispora thailandica]
MAIDDAIRQLRKRPEWSVCIISARFMVLGMLVFLIAVFVISFGWQDKPVVYVAFGSGFVMAISGISFGAIVVGVINPFMNAVNTISNFTDMSVQADLFSALREDIPSLGRWKSFDPDVSQH